ncbi:50S ribosomal protein L11 [Candidatus Woesearchaeota archaeon]|jgi:large subunit ribosomal protein L11|nr:50S ribosomal protein L11 [Candidatus Woesearchaeota archaeon]MBT5272984.1 50S ribosomal protein L11 [Candidatus Woesearchaeota archaeon]MBT6041450.1 50S ribosomal protein L11 [Candidatus Woesearchaeota archaeon]MBT6336475.1 50S ribosomal protein L11 [Candidatus Woesearchaeota archaeon]MBT7927365.1 50S ribosomal protein L11 [Candidatus Woesearchaeota archaeon]
MAKETIETLVDGGKATAGPPLGPALGPMGVNIGQVIAEINKKTADFKGMKVPVKVIIDKDTKEFEITVGTPPASALIKKEAGVQKGAGNPLTEKVADLKIEQVIKVANMKQDALLGKDNFGRAKEIVGTCQSMGIMVEGMPAHDAIDKINAGEWKDKIESGKTELSAEELKELAEEKKRLQEEMEKNRAEFEVKAKAILNEMSGKANKDIRKKMVEAEIPMLIINEVAPEEKAEGGDAKAEGAPAPEKK